MLLYTIKTDRKRGEAVLITQEENKSSWQELNGKMHGLYSSWFDSRRTKPRHMAMMKDGKVFGEYKEWDRAGRVTRHYFYYDDGSTIYNLYSNVEAVVQDINNITDEERMLIMLTWNIKCLPK